MKVVLANLTYMSHYLLLCSYVVRSFASNKRTNEIILYFSVTTPQSFNDSNRVLREVQLRLHNIGQKPTKNRRKLNN